MINKKTKKKKKKKKKKTKTKKKQRRLWYSTQHKQNEPQIGSPPNVKAVLSHKVKLPKVGSNAILVPLPCWGQGPNKLKRLGCSRVVVVSPKAFILQLVLQRGASIGDNPIFQSKLMMD